MAASTQQRGRQAEDLACRYLEARGLSLLERNYHCARGEIDLIMQHRESIVFVEVRYRNSAGFGGGAASVDYRKQSKLIATALHYLQQHDRMNRHPSRFDVIGIAPGLDQNEVQWIQDAFQAQ